MTITTILVIATLNSPVYEIEPPSQLYRLCLRNPLSARIAIQKTNHALQKLGKLSRSRQVQLQIEYLNRCELESRKRHVREDYGSRWDPAVLDVLAVAKGKMPVFNIYGELGFVTTPKSNEITIDWNVIRGSIEMRAPISICRPEAIAFGKKYVRSGYFVLG